jgi:hypothetical protein
MRLFKALGLLLILTVLPVFAQEEVKDKARYGIGLLVQPNSTYHQTVNYFEVIGVLNSSPAYDKIHILDQITEINGIAVSKIGVNKVLSILYKSGADQTISLLVNRNGKKLRIKLSTVEIDYSSDNIAESIHKIGKIKGFLSDNLIQTDLCRADKIKIGDTFLISDGKIMIGVARVKEVYKDFSNMLIIRSVKKIDSQRQYYYSLVYNGYFPFTARALTDEEKESLKSKNDIKPTEEKTE